MNNGTVFTLNTKQKRVRILLHFESKFYKNAGSLFWMTVLSHRTNVEAWNLPLQDLCRNISTMKKYFNYGKSHRCISSWLSWDSMHVTISNCRKLKVWGWGSNCSQFENDKHRHHSHLTSLPSCNKKRRLKISCKLK